MFNNNQLRRNIEWPLIALAYLLAMVGVFAIFSATRGDPLTAGFHKKQILNIVVGTIGLISAAALDYHLYVRFAKHVYIINLLLLVIVWKFAPRVNNAGRWIRIGGFLFQPSEFAKLFMIVCLAIFLSRRQEAIKEFKTLMLSLGYVAVPVALIAKQPDLSTALVILAVWFGMVFLAGAQLKHLGAIVLLGAVLAVGYATSPLMSSYQKHRIANLINPDSDSQNTGYHVTQARIAIGSGGMWGKGLLKSTQVRGGYIPEKQTDFIFTDVGEELGFVGSLVLLGLYALLLFRGILIIASADEDFLGKLIATGVVTMFAFHIIINIGMNIGLIPVAGIPLLFISYGGSNMIMTLTCVGLLQSVSLHRHQLLF